MAKLSEETIDGVIVLHLTGSLTQETIPDLEQRLKSICAEKSPRVVVDVAKVDALTTPALTVFLANSRAIEANGGKMIFANVRGITGDIFVRCRLDVIFKIAGNVAAAVKM